MGRRCMKPHITSELASAVEQRRNETARRAQSTLHSTRRSVRCEVVADDTPTAQSKNPRHLRERGFLFDAES